MSMFRAALLALYISFALVDLDAADLRGHHGDHAARGDLVAERLDDPHRAKRIREHQRDEIAFRHVERRVVPRDADAGVHEKRVELAFLKTRPSGGRSSADRSCPPT